MRCWPPSDWFTKPSEAGSGRTGDRAEQQGGAHGRLRKRLRKLAAEVAPARPGDDGLSRACLGKLDVEPVERPELRRSLEKEAGRRNVVDQDFAVEGCRDGSKSKPPSRGETPICWFELRVNGHGTSVPGMGEGGKQRIEEAPDLGRTGRLAVTAGAVRPVISRPESALNAGPARSLRSGPFKPVARPADSD